MTNILKKLEENTFIGPVILPFILACFIFLSINPVALFIAYTLVSMQYHEYQCKLFINLKIKIAFYLVAFFAGTIAVFFSNETTLWVQHSILSVVLFSLLYIVFVFSALITNNDKALNDILSLFVESIIIVTISFVAIFYQIDEAYNISIFITAYLILKISISLVALAFSKNQKNNSAKVVSYLFGKREELDKVVSLMITSIVFLFVISPIVIHDINKPVSQQLLSIDIVKSDESSVSVNVLSESGEINQQMPMLIERAFEGSPRASNYTINQEIKVFTNNELLEKILLLFILWSFSLLLLAWAKYILRFDKRGENPMSPNFHPNSKYHRGYDCDRSKFEYTKEKIEKQYGSNEEILLGKNKIDIERYTHALYELGRRDFLEVFNDSGKVIAQEAWSNSVDCCLNADGSLEFIDAKLLNDYCAIKLNNNEDEVQGIESILLQAHKAGEIIATYNLYLFYRKTKKKPENEIRVYLQTAKDEGYLPAINLYNYDLDKDYKSIGEFKYEIAAKNPVSSLLYQHKYTKPIEVFVVVLRLIFLSISIYFTMSIMQHSKAEYIGVGIGSLGVLGLGLGMVFKESLYSFFAGVRIYLDDLARVGDRVESESLGIHGRVHNFTLTNITVKNFDNSLIHMSLTSYLESSVLNWRLLEGMEGRRIKRSIIFDVRSFKRYHSKSETNLFENLFELEYLSKYYECKLGSFKKMLDYEGKTLPDDNRNVLMYEEGKYPNTRFITNIGLFREYVETYLHDHEFIDSKRDIVVSQLELTSNGLPIEIRAYTPISNEFTSFKNFQKIQSDIFEHILITSKYFGLELYQSEKDDGHLEYKDKTVISK